LRNIDPSGDTITARAVTPNRPFQTQLTPPTVARDIPTSRSWPPMASTAQSGLSAHRETAKTVNGQLSSPASADTRHLCRGSCIRRNARPGGAKSRHASWPGHNVLYQLAASPDAHVFHDVTTGNNSSSVLPHPIQYAHLSSRVSRFGRGRELQNRESHVPEPSWHVSTTRRVVPYGVRPWICVRCVDSGATTARRSWRIIYSQRLWDT